MIIKSRCAIVEEAIASRWERFRPIWLGICALGIALAFAYYIPLFGNMQRGFRDIPLQYYFHILLPIFSAHVLLAIIGFVTKKLSLARALLYWGGSLAIILCCGGMRAWGVALKLALLSCILYWAGNWIGRRLLPAETLGWGLSLGLGILAFSELASYFAWMHFLNTQALWAACLVPAGWGLLQMRSWSASRIRKQWEDYSAQWDFRGVLAGEILLILLVFLFVAASPPEYWSDAVRAHWPYIRLMAESGTFPDVNNQWQYVIPKAALAYAAGVLSIIGQPAVHWSMFLAGLSLMGILGLMAPIFLLLFIPGIWKSCWASRSYIVAGVLGTAILWTKSPYSRYWTPGVFLMTLGLVPGTAALLKRTQTVAWALTAAIILLFYYFPASMASNWREPRRWAWLHYSNKIEDSEYLDMIYSGYSKLAQFPPFGSETPRIWFSGIEGVGHLNVVPMTISVWEFSCFGIGDLESRIRFLGDAGCQYWVVNHKDDLLKWLRLKGVSRFYWDKESLVFEKGPLFVCRMKTPEEAFAAFEKRFGSGADLLLNGDFAVADAALPREWVAKNPARWIENAKEAHGGKGYVQTEDGGFFEQIAVLPDNAKHLNLEQWVSTTAEKGAVPYKVEVVWLNSKEETIGSIQS